MKLRVRTVFSSVTLAFLVALLCAAGTVGPTHAQDEHALPRAVDLQADALRARAERIPIVLFSNLTGCHFCRGALREVLLPMQRDAGWARTALFRQIDVDKAHAMVDFTGKKTTHADFAKAMKLQFAPTVMVVDASGKVLAEPVVGVASWDYYGYNVEEAIRKGFAATQAAAP